MKLASRIISAHRKFYLGTALFLLVLVGGAAGQVSAAGDCDNNSIISCGFSSPSDFINKVNANNSGNGHSDLKLLYSHFNLVPTEYSRFVTSSRQGTAYKDGRILVDGQVVANSTKSIGRLASYQGAGYFTLPLYGIGTYYGNDNAHAFVPNSLPVTVLFNSQGVMEFAVINSCGNPIYGNNVTPSYSCTALHQQPVANKPGTYNFTTSASAANNASVVKVVYDFGDGQTAQATSPSTVVTHTYAKAGSYTARVTVYVHLPGNQTVTVTSANCATVVNVTFPIYQCLQLVGVAIGNSKYQYKYTLTGKAQYGAVLKSADFKFGDGGTANGVPVSGGTTATATHTYSKDGNVTASALFHVQLPNGSMTTATSSSCAKQIPVAIPYYSCIQLGGAILDASKFSYSFTASANFGNGVTFKSADFDFGDSNVARNVIPSGTSVTTTHNYAAGGNYTAKATLYFIVNGDTKNVKSVSCTAALTPTQPPTPECKPGVPQGSALCTPCQYNSNIPASDTEHCVLPNTGAGNIIAVFGAAVVGGFLIFRQFIYKRNAFATADAGTVLPEGLFTGPVVSPETGVVVSHHSGKHHRAHPNAVKPLHHPSYQHPHRFRPETHKSDDE